MLPDQDTARPLREQPARIAPQTLVSGPDHILYDQAAIPAPGPEFFDPLHWRRADAETGTAMGRGATCIFTFQGQRYVLRHYRRGGWVSRLAEDSYFWTGLDDTRAWREWRLLASMYEQGLAVPRPVAARVHRHGLTYGADLVTLYIDGVRPLADILKQGALTAPQWPRIGREVARLHDAGVFHADLNVRNILIGDDARVWLIDFDKSERRSMAPGRRQANLDRLRRSLDKLVAQGAPVRFAAADWDALVAGYRESSR